MSASPSARTARSIVAGIVGFLAVIGVFASCVGFWAMDVATDSDRFEARVEELLQREDTSDALARRLTTEVVSALPVEEAVSSIVPEVLQPAAGLLLASARTHVEERVAEAIRSPEGSALVAGAAGRAHSTAVAVIEGDDLVDGITVTDGEVRLNLLPLAARAIEAMQEVGLFADVVVPDLDRSGDPATQRAELSAALGRDLPDDFGEPVVMRSDALDRAGSTVQLVRDLVVLAKRVAWLVLVIGLGLAGVAIWLARSRWRAAILLVAGLFATALVTWWVTGRAAHRLPKAVESPAAKRSIEDIATDLQHSLVRAVLVYALLAAVALTASAIVVNRRPSSGAAARDEERRDQPTRAGDYGEVNPSI